MRILHVSPTDVVGGAAKGTYNLHKALQAAGVDSRMLVVRKYSDDPSVIERLDGNHFIYEAIRDRLDRVPLGFYEWDRRKWWSVGWLPFHIEDAIGRIRPDVVHFHWVGRGAIPIDALSRLRRYPLVWTLRDMWPLTGGCHYSGDCDKFTEGCGACPQLGSTSLLDLSRWQWRRKRRAWKGIDITYVALSNWMMECARRSPLVFGNEIALIPNGIDVEKFKPANKAAARSIWEMPPDRKVIMFGALNGTNDPRKGFAFFLEALRQLAVLGWRDRAIAIVFGTDKDAIQIESPFSIRVSGFLHDHVSLALLYSCADVMVVPSIQENAGKVPIEAMACGVPVVAFNNTGQTDLVDHKINGYLAEDLSSADLAQGIAWCLERADTDDTLSSEARQKALRCFDVRGVAEQHVDLYRRLLAGRRSTARHRDKEPSSKVDALPAQAVGAGRVAIPPSATGRQGLT